MRRLARQQQAVGDDQSAADLDLSDEVGDEAPWMEGLRLSNLRQDLYSCAAYVDNHITDLESYVLEHYEPESFDGHVLHLLRNPYLAKAVVESYITPQQVLWSQFVNPFCFPKPSNRVVYCIGKPGSGKTTFAYDLAHAIHERAGRPVYAAGDPADVPEFVELINDIMDAPPGSVVIFDEAVINANARDAMKKDNKRLAAILAMIRQNDLILVVISQNTSLADKTLLTLADVLVIKPVGLTQGSTERKLLGRITRYWKEMLPRKTGEAFIVAKGLRMKVERGEPEWYTDAMSKAYRKLQNHEEAMVAATKRRKRGDSWNSISSFMAMRWEQRGADWWTDNVVRWNGGLDPRTGRPLRKRKGDSEEVPRVGTLA